jgi:hypothetical protein
MSATDDKLPPESWNSDGTITRKGCKHHPAFIGLWDHLQLNGGYVELYASGGKLAVLVVREARTRRVIGQRPARDGLEAAALALWDHRS